MFELEKQVGFQTGRKKLTVPLAMAIVAALVLLLVMTSSAKGAVKLRKQKETLVYTPLPKKPDHVKLVAVEREKGGYRDAPTYEVPAPRKPGRRFEAPSSIPQKPAVIDDAGRLPELAFGHGDNVAQGPEVGQCPVSICGSGNGSTQVAPPLAPPKVEIKPVSPQRIPVGGKVQSAKLIRQPVPVYPQMAKVSRVQGVVKLSAVIRRDGTIDQLTLISGHALLVPAAMDAVRHWVYSPTLLNGEAVEVITQIDVNFTLTQ